MADVKPGIKTTEFWGKVLVQIGTLATALAGQVPPKYAAGVIVVAEVAYAASRGVSKFKSFSISDILATVEAFLKSQGQPPAPPAA